MEDGFKKVASVADVPDGEMIAVLAPNGVQVALAHLGGEFYAFENMCTHEDASLNFGWLHAETCEVECPLHEGRYDVRAGQVTAAPPDFPLKTYNVRVEGDDVFVGPVKA
jgi:nitrite reductase/ring-hydroxylating ferredoxin subunit